MRRLLAATLSVFVCSVACGGAMAPEAPKSVAPSPRNGGAEGVPSTPSDTSTASPAPMHQQSTPGTFGQPPSRERSDFERAEQQVNASIGDCTTACRALASMESAAHHLCDLGDDSECRAAQQRVVAARDRVERACGKCR